MTKAWPILFAVALASGVLGASCGSGEVEPVGDGAAGAAGANGDDGTGGGTDGGTGGGKAWSYGEPLISEKGHFWITSYDGRLIDGTWQALRVEEMSTDIRWPYSLEFLPSEGVTVEVVDGEPHRFHAEKVGPARVPFRATDDNGTVEDAFVFQVEEPKSAELGTCDRVLGGFGTDVRLLLNGRIGTVGAPQGLLPVEVAPAPSAEVRAIDGYLSTQFQILVSPGFVGSFELRSTLADASKNTLVAVEPGQIEAPRLFAQGTVAVGKMFMVAVEPWTADGVVCARLPTKVTATAASACRILKQTPASFYSPNERIKYEVVGDVIGGSCELVAQYDQAEIEATLGVDFYASLSADVTGPVTIQLDIDIVDTPPPGATVDIGGGSSGSSGGGWD